MPRSAPSLTAGSDELESPARRALRRLFQRKGAVVGLLVIATFIVLAVFAPLIVPYDPIATSWTLVRKPPSALHWFGTDDLGRDILGRVIYGARASLMAGAISVGIALGIGVPFGLLSGYRGGFIDALISRITDAMLACPFLILAIALAAFLGPSLGNAMIAIGITTTPIFVRLTRGQVMSVKVEDYVEAARAMGNPRWRIALFHILPNIMPALLVQATLVDRGRDHRRGGAVVPGTGPAAAGAVLGQHAERRAALPRPTRRGWRCGRAWRSSWWCCRSTWSATACATRSIRGSGERYISSSSRQASQRVPAIDAQRRMTGSRLTMTTHGKPGPIFRITVSRITRRQSISYSRSITGGRAKCQVRPERVAPRRTSSSATTG